MEDWFVKEQTFAVVGVSSDPEKWGAKIYLTMKARGYEVYPINPKYEEVFGDRCYSGVSELPVKPDVVITVVPPKVTLHILKECLKAGVKKVWMQPGSESDDAVKFCHENNMTCMHSQCFVVDGLKTDFVIHV